MVEMTHPEPYMFKLFELSEVTLSFVEWCVHLGNGTRHLPIFLLREPIVC